MGPPHLGFVELEDHPDIRGHAAVDEVINSNNINRESDAFLVKAAEQAAAAEALTTYERMIFAAIPAADAANEARRARAPWSLQPLR